MSLDYKERRCVTIKILNIVGARPQFIKLVPILKAIRDYNSENSGNPIKVTVIHTGQHYDYGMSQVFFEELGLPPPDYHLDVGSGTHAYQTGLMLIRIEGVLLKEKPDLVLVYGDTNSTLAGALAAAKLHIPIAHVEAGLRSFNREMPEEINRVLTDHISDLLFCPTETAVRNLDREGITNIINGGKLISLEMKNQTFNFHKPLVLNVGDIMYDALLMYLELAEEKSTIIDRLGLRAKEYALATVHRAENTDNIERLEKIWQSLIMLANSGLKVVVPLHPRTRKILSFKSFKLSSNNLLAIEPISYLDMLLLEKNAKVILTDSGGVQKEAFFLKVPCITFRKETEWVETVETGWNILVDSDAEKVYHAVLNVKEGIKSVSPYGDGLAGKRIVEFVARYLK